MKKLHNTQYVLNNVTKYFKKYFARLFAGF